MIWLVPSTGGCDLTFAKHLGFIIQPNNGLHPVKLYPYSFAIDNGAYGGKFNPSKFRKLVKASQEYADRCLFVALPDVVGDATATQNLWKEYYKEFRQTNLPLAYVAQDGIIEPPWDELDCLFIGGTNDFKMSEQVLRLLHEAKLNKKWRHVGRINSRKRLRHFWEYMDSFDGTDWCRGPRIKLDFYQKAIHLELMQKHMELV